MTRRSALALARRMEKHLERQWEIGQTFLDAARDGCPIAQAAYDALLEQSLPHPLTCVVLAVEEAARLIDAPNDR